jgi:copper chaperone CopZ
VRDTLKTIPGVKSADVDFARARATVTIDTKVTKPETVADQLSDKTKGRYTATVIKE